MKTVEALKTEMAKADAAKADAPKTDAAKAEVKPAAPVVIPPLGSEQPVLKPGPSSDKPN